MTLKQLINPSLTCAENARKLGVSYRTVYCAAQRHRITLPRARQGRPPGILAPHTIARIERIRHHRSLGLPLKDIAKLERLSPQRVSQICAAHSIP